MADGLLNGNVALDRINAQTASGTGQGQLNYLNTADWLHPQVNKAKPGDVGYVQPSGGLAYGGNANLQKNAEGAVTGVQGGQIQTGYDPGGAVQTSLDTSGVPKVPGENDLSGAMQKGQNTAYEYAKSRLDPQWSNAQNDLENQLTQQGIMRGSDAWNRSVGEFGRNRNDAYSGALNQSWNNGLASQGQLFNQGLAANQNAFGQALNKGQFGNQAQSQVNQQNFQQGQFGNYAQNQGFNQGIQNANLVNPLFTNQQNRDTAAQNARTNGLFGLAGTALMNPNITSGLGGLLNSAGSAITNFFNPSSNYENYNPQELQFDPTQLGSNGLAQGVSIDYSTGQPIDSYGNPIENNGWGEG